MIVITKIIGGIGNQLFQYATARSISDKHGCKLLLDTSAFEDYQTHPYMLSEFRIRGDLAPKYLTKLMASRSLNTIAKELLGHNLLLKEPHFHYFSGDLKPPILLDGYWQSYKYFDFNYKQLLADIQPKKALSQNSTYYLEKIDHKERKSISIHVRRGDYNTNPNATAVHGLLPIEYYDIAIRRLSELELGEFDFFVFSDDLNWAKDNLQLPLQNTYYVEGNQERQSYEDLFLMSKCNINIIANSTFSWWGAYLNSNENKTIIAPKRWFSTNKLDSKDLHPNSWCLL